MFTLDILAIFRKRTAAYTLHISLTHRSISGVAEMMRLLALRKSLNYYEHFLYLRLISMKIRFILDVDVI